MGLRTASAIVAAAVGTWACSGPVRSPCNDGLDNDGDGLFDSDDVGCTLSRGTSEVPEPPGPPPPPTPPDPEPPADAGPDARPADEPPACSDGLDNDGDGSRDFPEDAGCESPDDNDEIDDLSRTCGPLVPVRDLDPATAAATGEYRLDDGALNLLTSANCGGRGGERAYRYIVESGPKTLEITTDHPETTLDTVLYVRSVCLDRLTELACSDDGGTAAFGKSSTVTINGVAAGEYIIVVDAFGPASLGRYKLTVTER